MLIIATIAYYGVVVCGIGSFLLISLLLLMHSVRSAVVSREVVCRVTHPWYRAARVQPSKGDWTTVVCCTKCGDKSVPCCNPMLAWVVK